MNFFSTSAGSQDDFSTTNGASGGTSWGYDLKTMK